jgi:hypothetical protein
MVLIRIIVVKLSEVSTNSENAASDLQKMLEFCYKSCDESGSGASSCVWNALATTTIKKRNNEI